MAPDSRAVLAFEMALSGVGGETFALAPSCVGGPAFLVYYSPAYLRHCCATKDVAVARDALHALSEVYRAARLLWPLESEGGAQEGGAGAQAASQTVTVMVDELKSSGTAEVLGQYSAGKVWVLLRSNAKEAEVRRKPVEELATLLAAGNCVLLRLWQGAADRDE